MRGVYGPESRRSFAGALAHRIFARHLADGEIPAERLAAVCREEIGSAMNSKLVELRLRPSQLDGVIGEVSHLYGRFRGLDTGGFAGAEVPIGAEPAEGVALRGVVDAVFDRPGLGIRLVDWKTGGIGDPRLQLGFYAMVWTLERRELPARMEALSIRTGEHVEEVPTRAGIQGIADRAGSAVDALRRAWDDGRALDRVAGPWCRWCPLLEECSEGATAASLPE